MASTAPIVDRIRIIPRPNDFLNRNVGSSGEVFFDTVTNSLRLYSGNLAGGFEVLTDKSLSGIASYDYTVTVTNPGSGNKFVLNGENNPELSFVIGYTYVFDQSDPTNVWYPNAVDTTVNQHPLNFSSDDANGELGGGTTYIDRVTYKLDNKVVKKQQYWDNFATAIQRSVSITITTATPTTLYYWCQNHLNMGNTIAVAAPGTGSSEGGTTTEVSDTAPSEPTNGTIWFDSTNAKLYVYVQDIDSSQWVQPSYPIPTALTDLGISDGTAGQVLTTDGAGNFSFAEQSSVGNFSFSSSIITTDDSSGISFVPAVTMNSDLTVENDLTVNNNVSAVGYISTGTGTAIIDSATTITLSAPDGVIITDGSGNNITVDTGNIVSTGDITAANFIGDGSGLTNITADSSNLETLTFGTSGTPGTDTIVLAANSNNFIARYERLFSGENVYFGRFSAGTRTALTYGSSVGGQTGSLFENSLSFNSTTGFTFDRTVSFDGTARLANLSTTDRNALSASNGDLIYNTTDNRLQGYQNGAWINIDDGSAA